MYEPAHFGRPTGHHLRGLMQGQLLEDLDQVVLAAGPTARSHTSAAASAGSGCERVTSHSPEQCLDIEAPLLTIILDPVDTGVEDLGLAAHIQIVSADESPAGNGTS